ncbi:MAG: PD-(D/E)XK nuclease family protein [Myxococcaceae bacterium]
MNSPLRPDQLHFSVSQMKQWLMCPRKFSFRYIIGATPEFQPLPLAFGIAFHAALAHHYGWLMQGQRSSVDETKQQFVDSLNKAKADPLPLKFDVDEPFEQVQAKGLQMLDVTLTHPSASPAKVLAVEKSFTVDLFDVGSGEVLDEKLTGVIDLVVEEDNHPVLVEHKTTARKYSLDQLVFDTQLSGYAFAAEHLGWGDVGLRFSVTTKTKVPAVQVEDVRRDEFDVAVFLRTAVGVLQAIDKGISFPVRGWHCRGCPYQACCSKEH